MTEIPYQSPVVIITGAAGATGAAIAEHFFNLGASLCLVDIQADRLATITEPFGDRAMPMVADISRADNAERIADCALGHFGAVDVLVNNAGILTNNKVNDTSDSEWRDIFSVNLDGAFYLSRAVLPAMRKRKKGRIVNVCSLAMKTGGLTAGTAYTASKGALSALTFSLARECAADGVTVNGIAPAYVRTPMVTEQLTDEQRDRLLAQIPVGRFCEPDEIAHLIAFLASDHAGFITGEIVDINGGLHLD